MGDHEQRRNRERRRWTMGQRVVMTMIVLSGCAGAQGPADTFKRGTTFRDCPDCPQMIVLPPGEYTMGSPASESDRTSAEGAQHRVRIGYAFAVAKFDVTRAEFQKFAAETGYDAKSGGCHVYAGGDWKMDAAANWQAPGFAQATNDPAVCMSWNDAEAYIGWLSKKSGKSYRLLSESEWEYAARAGTSTVRPWGDGLTHSNANYMPDDSSAQAHDRRVYTTPVGSFPANTFGLYDMLGNTWQWVEDCWHDDYSGAPTDGSAWQAGDCANRVRRGGSWHDHPEHIRSAIRFWGAPSDRFSNFGFRVAQALHSSA